MRAGEKTREALGNAAEAELLWSGHQSYSGNDINHAVSVLAGQFAGVGPPGTRVGIWAWNSAETIIAHLAVERAGMTRVPVDPEAPRAEASHIFDAAQVSVILVDVEHKDAGVFTAPLISVGPDVWGATAGDFSAPEVRPDDVSTLVVRGIMPGGLLAIPLSIRNWEAHMDLAESLFRDGTFGRALDADPFFVTTQQVQYGTGLVGTFPFLRMGFAQDILKKFNADSVIESVLRHDATATFFVPGMVSRLAAAMPGGPGQGWRLSILYGGAPLPLDDMRTAIATLGAENLVQLYGRFEGGWPLTILSPQDHQRIADGDTALAGSCGRQVAGVELDLHPVPGSTVPELRSRSACVSDAYADPDGWCSLGDLASRDEQGYYYLHGRLDGMINTGSFHVYPEEVAEAIKDEYENLIDVNVVSREDPKWGEAVTAILTWAAQTQIPSDEEFRQRMSARLAKYKVPTVIEHHHDSQ